MNRVIRFRGRKSFPYGNVWYYGSLWQNAYGEAFIRTDKGISLGVDPETVGQFTGLLDSMGNEIYEGDVLQKEDIIWVTTWNKDDGGFIVEQPSYGCYGRTWYWLGFGNNKTLTVIGNIYDNPKLINRK